MGNIDLKREYSHEDLTATWKNNLHKIENLTYEEKRKRYFGLDSGFRSVSNIDYPNMLDVRYNEDKQTIVVEFEYLPGIEWGTLYEIRNITDETHAWRVSLTFFTALFIELCKVIPKTTVEAMVEQNKEAVSWSKNYAAAK